MLLLLLLLATRSLSEPKTRAEEELKWVYPTLIIILLLGRFKTLDAHHRVDGVLGHLGKVEARHSRSASGVRRAHKRIIYCSGFLTRDEGVHIHAGTAQRAGAHERRGRTKHSRRDKQHG